MGSPVKKAPSGPYADKLWREALRRAVLKRVEKERRLDRIAEQVVSKAEGGDLIAVKEIGDRLDGKPAMTLDATVTHDVRQLSDQELLAIIAEGSGKRDPASPRDQGQLH